MQHRRMTSLFLATAALAGAVVLVLSAPASAGFETYSDPGGNVAQPLGMDEAPDGTLWFASYGTDRIGQVDPTTGTITTYTDPNVDGPRSVSVAPDGTVWFTSSDNGRLGKVVGGVITTYDIGLEQIDDVEIAVDGDVWVNGFPSSGDARMGRFEPDTEDYHPYTIAGQVARMTPHPTDGMWFIWFNPAATLSRIGHMRVDTSRTFLPTGAMHDPSDITTGSDGRLWFTGEDDGAVARLNPATGVVTVFSHPQVSSPNEIIDGPGGDLWFSIRSGGRFGRLDPATGAIVTYRDPTDTVEGPIGLAVGGDGNLWYTRVADGTNDLVGRLKLGTCQGRTVTVDYALGSRPTNGPDVVLGSPGADTINALGGDDVVCSAGGDDTVTGGLGNDKLYLGGGSDLAYGNDGHDQIYGNVGGDVAYGGAGNDTIKSEGANDLLLGEAGNDLLDGGSENDALGGGPGRDTCQGGTGRDTSSTCEVLVGIP
jgi:streptogramin lyase